MVLDVLQYKVHVAGAHIDMGYLMHTMPWKKYKCPSHHDIVIVIKGIGLHPRL